MFECGLIVGSSTESFKKKLYSHQPFLQQQTGSPAVIIVTLFTSPHPFIPITLPFLLMTCERGGIYSSVLYAPCQTRKEYCRYLHLHNIRHHFTTRRHWLHLQHIIFLSFLDIRWKLFRNPFVSFKWPLLQNNLQNKRNVIFN